MAAREVAEELGRLALALEQAAATIEKLRSGFRHYLEVWQSNRRKVVGWARPEITGYHHAVAATWQTSVDQLTEAGRHLLERLAFLAPDPVPMFLLDVAVPGVAAEDLHDGLTDLTTVSLAIRDREGERFAVHRLVQDVSRRRLDATQTRRRVSEALAWVNAAFSSDPYYVRGGRQFDPLVPHARSVIQASYAAGVTGPTAELLTIKLKRIIDRAAAIEPLMRRLLSALIGIERDTGQQHPERNEVFDGYAVLLAEMGKSEAEIKAVLASLETEGGA